MKKTILIASVILFLGAVLLGLYSFFTRQKNTTLSGNVPEVGVLPEVQIQQSLQNKIEKNKEGGDEYLVLQGVNGSAKVRNFYKQTIDTEEGGVIFQEGDGYTLSYRPEEGFRIFIFNEKNPMGAQKEAESVLLSTLDADGAGVCRIGVSVWYPYESLPRPASFCR